MSAARQSARAPGEEMRRARAALRAVRQRADGRVLVFTGAGCSADSKIPTFRGSNAGTLWGGISGKVAMAVFGTPFGWRWLPQRAWRHYLKDFYLPICKAEPHAGHMALSQFESEFRKKASSRPNYSKSCFTTVTMNVDNLHQRAGSTNVHELHGSTSRHRCVEKGHMIALNEYDPTKTDEEHIQASIGVRCAVCDGFPRPDCVLFTEALPNEPWVQAEYAAEQLRGGDVCIVIGTTASVYPAAYIPEIASTRNATMIEINMDETRFTRAFKPIFLRGKASDLLEELLAELDSEEAPALGHDKHSNAMLDLSAATEEARENVAV
eukprot:CAMPEP_0202094824 /NCGR_PEP_ID=MMETSP0964-20121228/49237_1 /ASSEMBLY_ACC=CAM_ASM_000500 /TAXON_ID=4773 /ORGANISM="Schizochytrium aggregatum, Strain ATCC28209" /LENGTH=323 /DNA_ID=CAMNT_0048663079 /DNA_START=6 /DNA_END=977 /DNA_ORIENTATION=+